MPGQHGQQYRPQHIPLLWCVRTHVLQWTLLHPLVEQPASFQKFDEKWHLAQIAHRRFRNPFHLDLTGKSVHASVVFRHYVAPQNSLTLWLSLHNHFFLAHAPQYPLFTFSPNSRTAFFKFNDDQRRRLAAKAKEVGRKLLAQVETADAQKRYEKLLESDAPSLAC